MSPLCETVNEHVPLLIKETTLPETVQMLSVLVETETVNPEVAPAINVKLPAEIE